MALSDHGCSCQAALQRILSSNETSVSEQAQWPRTVGEIPADGMMGEVRDALGEEWNATRVLPAGAGSDSSSEGKSVDEEAEVMLNKSLQKVRAGPS